MKMKFKFCGQVIIATALVVTLTGCGQASVNSAGFLPALSPTAEHQRIMLAAAS